MTAGIICVSLGILGIILPVLPTTPFLLLAALLFSRSSKKFHDRLINSKILGEYIYNYRKYHAIKRKTKIIAIFMLWATLVISAMLIDNIYIRILLFVVGISVTIHILYIKTLENIRDK